MRSLIVLGASARAAAFSAIRAGFAPYAIDPFADRDLAAACPAVKIARYPHEFLAALAAAPAAPWLYAGGLENHPRLVDRLANLRPLLGNRGEVLRRVRDPARLASAAKAAGLPFPRLAEPGEALARGGEWLLKPRRSGGGVGICFATTEEVRSPPRGVSPQQNYLQQHIAGEAASAVFVAAGGRATLLGATRQLLGGDFSLPQAFLYVGSLGPLELTAEEVAKLQQLGDVLAKEFSLVGLFNVDFVRTKETLWPLEVNPRYSASIEVLERTVGFSSIALHVAACELAQAAETRAGETPTPRCGGKAVVYAQRDTIISEKFEALVQDCLTPGEWPEIADLPRVGEAIRAGQPVTTVFAEGRSLAAVESALRSRVAAVQATLRFPTSGA